MELDSQDRWVACSAGEFGHVGRVRHIVAKGGKTAVCGASASHVGIWRGNTTKPRCLYCMKRYDPTGRT